jgi:hypothetical protein
MQSRAPYSPGYQRHGPYHWRSLDTEKGLKHFIWGIVVYILGTLLVFFAGLITGALLRGAAVRTYICAVGMICMGGVLLLVAYILWLLGIYEMYTGRKEYGRTHALNVHRAVILAVLFANLLVSIEILSFATLGVGSNEDPQMLLENLRTSAVALGILDVVRSIVVGLGFTLLIVELCDENFKRVLWTAFLVIVIATVTGIVISIASLDAVDPSVLDSEELSQLSYLSSLALGLTFIPFILYLICYRHAYNRVRNRELQRTGSTLAAGYPPSWDQRVYERTCPNCYSYPQANDVFCAYCGTKLE